MNKNKLLVRLFSDKKRYADLINGYSGAHVVRAEDLSELDSISHVFPSYGEERHSHHSDNKTEGKKNLSPGEFLSGFRKTDRLHPCITLVLFWGEKWDGRNSSVPSLLRAKIH